MPTEPRPAFVFVGGRPCLDLVATLGRRHAGGVERIPDLDALSRWFVAAGVLAAAPRVTAAASLGRARQLREAIATLVRGTIAGQPADGDAVRAVNAGVVAAYVPPRLVVDPDGGLAVRLVDGAAGAGAGRHRPGRGPAARRTAGVADQGVRASGLLAGVPGRDPSRAAPLVLHGALRKPGQDGRLPGPPHPPRRLELSRPAGARAALSVTTS